MQRHNVMIRRPFREHHIINILNEYDRQILPMDFFLSTYFRANKALGSKDRGVIAETVYGMIRWRGLLDHARPQSTWEQRFDCFVSPAFNELKHSPDIPLHIRLSFPKILFDKIVDSHGMDKSIEICTTCNEAAPTTARVNTLKITRDALLQQWEQLYQVAPCRLSQEGIVFTKKVNFFEMPEFKQGLFEVQDEGSQLLAGLIKAQPGELVMDYCAGAGGKTLAFGPRMQNKGQIFLHDIRKYALEDCRKRLRRAGLQNAQVLHHDDASKLKKLKKKMDWVLVDAPCTGTGTLRRNPDMKWKFSLEMLERLVGQQRMIFERALSFLKPEGQIIFATCSLLKEENEEQVAHFMKTYGLIESDRFQTLPIRGGMDGFYGISLKKG